MNFRFLSWHNWKSSGSNYLEDLAKKQLWQLYKLEVMNDSLNEVKVKEIEKYFFNLLLFPKDEQKLWPYVLLLGTKNSSCSKSFTNYVDKFFVHLWPFIKMHLNFYIPLMKFPGIKNLENIQEILNAYLYSISIMYHKFIPT